MQQWLCHDDKRVGPHGCHAYSKDLLRSLARQSQLERRTQQGHPKDAPNKTQRKHNKNDMFWRLLRHFVEELLQNFFHLMSVCHPILGLKGTDFTRLNSEVVTCRDSIWVVNSRDMLWQIISWQDFAPQVASSQAEQVELVHGHDHSSPPTRAAHHPDASLAPSNSHGVFEYRGELANHWIQYLISANSWSFLLSEIVHFHPFSYKFPSRTTWQRMWNQQKHSKSLRAAALAWIFERCLGYSLNSTFVTPSNLDLHVATLPRCHVVMDTLPDPGYRWIPMDTGVTRALPDWSQGSQLGTSGRRCFCVCTSTRRSRARLWANGVHTSLQRPRFHLISPYTMFHDVSRCVTMCYSLNGFQLEHGEGQMCSLPINTSIATVWECLRCGPLACKSMQRVRAMAGVRVHREGVPTDFFWALHFPIHSAAFLCPFYFVKRLCFSWGNMQKRIPKLRTTV